MPGAFKKGVRVILKKTYLRMIRLFLFANNSQNKYTNI